MKEWKKLIIYILCTLFVFTAGFTFGGMTNIGIYTNGTAGNSNVTPAQPAAPETTQPAVTQPVATQPAESQPAETQPATPNQDTSAPAENQDTTAPAQNNGSSENGAIAKKMNDAMNALKAEKNMKAKKTEKTVINITACSVNSLTGMLNSICQKVAGEKVTNFDFVNGSAVGIKEDGSETNDGNPQSPKEALPPKGEDFNIMEAGVKSATEEKNGDNTTYTVVLVSETSSIDAAPQYNKAAVGFLNLGGFEIPTVTITQADIDYPETIIKVTVNGAGKVTAFSYEQPMKGTMGMKIAIAPGSADFDGGNYENWEFTY